MKVKVMAAAFAVAMLFSIGSAEAHGWRRCCNAQQCCQQSCCSSCSSPCSSTQEKSPSGPVEASSKDGPSAAVLELQDNVRALNIEVGALKAKVGELEKKADSK